MSNEKADRRAADREAARLAAAAAEKKRKIRVALGWTGLVAAILVVIIVVALVAKSSTKSQQPAAAPTTTSYLQTLTHIPQSTYDSVGIGTASKLASTTDGPITENGKPVVIYVGAEFCPFCAGERWAVIAALSRFGTWSNLTHTSSSATDVYPSTSTFTFHRASYTSPYLVFSGTEAEDGQGQPLDTPNARDTALWNKVAQGGFPFIDIAGVYALAGAQFQPTSLHTNAGNPSSAPRSWEEIVADLANPSSAASKQILGAANILTAEICSQTNNQPANVCTSPGVVAAR